MTLFKAIENQVVSPELARWGDQVDLVKILCDIADFLRSEDNTEAAKLLEGIVDGFQQLARLRSESTGAEKASLVLTEPRGMNVAIVYISTIGEAVVLEVNKTSDLAWDLAEGGSLEGVGVVEVPKAPGVYLLNAGQREPEPADEDGHAWHHWEDNTYLTPSWTLLHGPFK